MSWTLDRSSSCSFSFLIRQRQIKRRKEATIAGETPSWTRWWISLEPTQWPTRWWRNRLRLRSGPDHRKCLDTARPESTCENNSASRTPARTHNLTMIRSPPLCRTYSLAQPHITQVIKTQRAPPLLLTLLLHPTRIPLLKTPPLCGTYSLTQPAS